MLLRLIKLSSGCDLVTGGHEFVGTEEECREVLSEHVCDGCYEGLFCGEGLDNGGVIAVDGLYDLLWTSCGAEFMVEGVE